MRRSRLFRPRQAGEAQKSRSERIRGDFDADASQVGSGLLGVEGYDDMVQAIAKRVEDEVALGLDDGMEEELGAYVKESLNR